MGIPVNIECSISAFRGGKEKIGANSSDVISKNLERRNLFLFKTKTQNYKN